LAIVKNGAGTQTLSGVNTYTGGTVVNGGKLVVNGSITGAVNVNNNATLGGSGNVAGLVTVASGGILSPGNSPGILTVGSLTLNNGSLLDIELSGSARGSQSDAVVSTGSVSLGGTLQVSLISFSPSSGQSFDILDWGSLAGTFATLQLPALAGGLIWNTSQLYTDGLLKVGGVIGDYNHNGLVDAADYVIWRKSIGSFTNLAADGNNNGLIDQADFNVWRSQLGQTAGSGAGATANAAVPEPATMVLLVFVVACWCLGRGRATQNVPTTR
jgi:autotransporter-associated beta strand protein